MSSPKQFIELILGLFIYLIKQTVRQIGSQFLMRSVLPDAQQKNLLTRAVECLKIWVLHKINLVLLLEFSFRIGGAEF